MIAQGVSEKRCEGVMGQRQCRRSRGLPGRGKVKMTTVDTRGAQFNDRGEVFAAEELSAAEEGSRDGGLVLPQEGGADLAGQLVARARAGGWAGERVALTGRDGLLSGLIGQVLQAGLGLELEEHLAAGDGNGRNGFRARTLSTEAGPVSISVPRDRAGTFEPALIPKGVRRTAGISDTVISLYAGGMSVRDIARHCQRTMGIEISHDTISKITDECLEEMRAWQVRPLEAIYPIVYVDALGGLGEEITATWPEATVQTCTVHLIRAAARFASYGDRKGLCAGMRAIYTAVDIDAAEAALLEFADSALGRKYPAAAGVWERAWEKFVPFLEFEPGIRKVIYTTNAIEAFNRQMRKIIKTRGHFPNDDALVKLLWLGIVDIEDRRAAERARQAGRPKNQRTAEGHLIEGTATQGWREALAAFDKRWPGRIPDWAM